MLLRMCEPFMFVLTALKDMMQNVATDIVQYCCLGCANPRADGVCIKIKGNIQLGEEWNNHFVMNTADKLTKMYQIISEGTFFFQSLMDSSRKDILQHCELLQRLDNLKK